MFTGCRCFPLISELKACLCAPGLCITIDIHSPCIEGPVASSILDRARQVNLVNNSISQILSVFTILMVKY